MERLKQMKDSLVSIVQSQMSGHLDQVDTKELGDAIDMIKDLEEAIYYATITKAMTEQEKQHENGNEGKEVMYYPYPMYYPMDNTMHYPRGGGDGDGRRGYDEYYDPSRDMDRSHGKMYYNGNGSSSRGNQAGGSQGNGRSSSGNMGGDSRSFHEYEYPYPIDMRDKREGRSPMSRKMYMEAKEMHHGKEVQLKELEKYMQELTQDVTEMIKDSSPEEKQLLQKKIAALAEKVGQVNV